MKTTTSYKELITQAEYAESNDDLENAVTLYERAVKAEPANEYAYNRLMIIYRKLKKYKEELRAINEGIKFFEEYHENKSKELFGKNRKIMQLSNALMKSTGLQDKKGKSIYYPEPIGKWQKRKQTVLKKLKK